jgi:hypothetical protein
MLFNKLVLLKRCMESAAEFLQPFGTSFLSTSTVTTFIVRDAAGLFGRGAELLQSGRTNVTIHGIGEINHIQATCMGGTHETMLTLRVNGQKVADARSHRGETFNPVAFVVTTLHAIGNSTRTAVPGVTKEFPGSPTAFEAEVLFHNFIVQVP